jgi:hypothetical protein
MVFTSRTCWGTRLYARASLKANNGDSLKVESYRPENQGSATSLVALIKRVAKDDKRNIYKVTFS